MIKAVWNLLPRLACGPLGMLQAFGLVPGWMPSVPVVALLRAITTTVVVRNTVTSREQSCLGFVAVVRGRLAYVAMAKSCVRTLAVLPPGPAATPGDLGIRTAVRYEDGSAGAVEQLLWTDQNAALIAVASYSAQPVAYSTACIVCIFYGDFGAHARIPVRYMYATHDRRAAIPACGVLADIGSTDLVFLPPVVNDMAGSPVLDGVGGLVGIVSAEPRRHRGIIRGRDVQALVAAAVRAQQK